MSFPTIHLRAEQKPLEHRSFSPAVISTLVKAGYPVHVERSSTDPAFVRIFSDSEYEAAGAKLVPEQTWQDVTPGKGTVILGLKEIPEEEFALRNDHVAFSHCYKNQGGWQEVLSRFPRGGGVLYDLEFLVDEKGRRVSAFGYANHSPSSCSLKLWSALADFF
jgi:saccharopine dehydrogenase (NAD+, L-lysine-forming)